MTRKSIGVVIYVACALGVIVFNTLVVVTLRTDAKWEGIHNRERAQHDGQVLLCASLLNRYDEGAFTACVDVARGWTLLPSPESPNLKRCDDDRGCL